MLDQVRPRAQRTSPPRPRTRPGPGRQGRDRRRRRSTRRSSTRRRRCARTAIVNEALLGTEPDDLSKLIKSFGVWPARWAATRPQLQGLITNFNITTAAFAARVGATSRPTIRLLGADAAQRQRGLHQPQRRLPADARVRAGDPARRARDAGDDRRLVPLGRADARAARAQASCGGLARRAPAHDGGLAELTDDSIALLPQIDMVNRCLTQRDPPDRQHQDQRRRSSTTGVENYKEFWYAMVALAGEGQNFDGNGSYVRFQAGGGSQTVSTGKTTLGGDRSSATRSSRRSARSPRTRRRAAVQADVACARRSSRTSTAPRPAESSGRAHTAARHRAA